MVLKSQFAISLLHLVVSGIRTDTQHFIRIFEGVAREVQHRIDLIGRQAHPLGTLLQGRDLTLRHAAIGLRHHREEVQQLQSLRIVHLKVDLSTALSDGLFELCPALTLLFVEEFGQYLIALIHSILTEILAQHLAYHLHLRVHRLAIGLDDIRREHQQREQETVTLSLLLTLTIGPLIGLVIILIGSLTTVAAIALRARAPRSRVVWRVHPIEHRVEQRTQQIPCQRSQRPSSHPADKSSYPLSCSHTFYL